MADERAELNHEGVVEGRETWGGEPTYIYTGSPDYVAAQLPTFGRRPFAMVLAPAPSPPTQQAELFSLPDPSANAFLDAIVRLPTRSGEAEVPVGVVSKKYSLVQHRELLQAALAALGHSRVEVSKVRARLVTSHYGGRIALSLFLPPEYDFNPGDGHKMALRLECFNSVDGSMRLCVVMGWLRFVCSNGMVVGMAMLEVRSRHTQFLRFDDIPAAVEWGMAQAVGDRESLTRWRSHSVSRADLISWVDGALRRKWGVRAAARAYHIATTGHDGVFEKEFEKHPPHGKTMKDGVRVPGTPDRAENAFDLSQILAWLAKERRDVQAQVARREDIPELMQGLLKE